MLVSQKMSRSFKLSCFMLNVDMLERAKTRGVWGGVRTPNDGARFGKTCVFTVDISARGAGLCALCNISALDVATCFSSLLFK
jgi:hypothetical protein